MSQKQNAGQNHNIKVVNESSKNVAQCNCLRMTITNESCTLEKIRNCLNQKDCLVLCGLEYLSYHAQPRNMKIKLHRA
jgi:hypothetical protein